MYDGNREGSPETPVTVKCRIGVDSFDSYDLLRKYLAHLTVIFQDISTGNYYTKNYI